MNPSDERTKSLWMRVEVLPNAAQLDGSLKADTVIVGSGIAGLSVAYELAERRPEGQSWSTADRSPAA